MRQSVAHIVRDLVENVAAWDMEVTLYGAQLATEEKSYEIRTLQAKLKQVETRNTFLEDHLRKLKEIYLFYNQLTGPIPESFINLRCLNSIGVSNNQLDGIEDAREMLREAFGLKVNLRWL